MSRMYGASDFLIAMQFDCDEETDVSVLEDGCYQAIVQDVHFPSTGALSWDIDSKSEVDFLSEHCELLTLLYWARNL